MRKGLILIIGLIVGYAISWAFTVGIIKLITMCKCTKCGAVQEYESTFCCHCGAPMTDEAVEMVVKRMEVLNDAD